MTRVGSQRHKKNPHFLYKEALSAKTLLTNSTYLAKFHALKSKHNQYLVSFLHVSALPG
jgi:hypothetical protein